MCSLIRQTFIAGALAAVFCALAGSAMAETISAMEQEAAKTTGLTLGAVSDPNAVITSILSQPGTVNGLTYTSWSFLVNDGTGSMDIFGTMPTGSTYTPTLSDAITATGEYYPFHQTPELEYLTAISPVASREPVSVPAVITIPVINQPTLPLGGPQSTPPGVAGYLYELDDVTISGITGTFGIVNLTGTITDGGGNHMTLYYWPTSYSVANANLSGMAIPTGPVNMIGFVSVYSSVAEFTPITITPAVPAPEPGMLTLAATGLLGLALVAWRRRRKD